MIDPKKDGIEHINIYSKGRTALGIFLSNFTQCDLETEDGEFSSIEGYWYWLLCPKNFNPNCYECEGVGVTALGEGQQTYLGPCPVCNRDTLRYLYGAEAKKIGRTLQGSDFPQEKDENFKNKIKSAIKFKIDNNIHFKNELGKSTLPLVHYYLMYGNVKIPNGGEWVIDYIDELREEYKNV
jgi:hypothetical protein